MYPQTNQQGIVLGYAQQAQTLAVPVEIPALDSLENRFGEVSAQLDILQSRARSVAERVFGPTPQAVPENKLTGAAPPMPVMRRLEQLADHLQMKLRLVSDELSRLERL